MEIIEIKETIESGKLKWLPTLIQNCKEEKEKEGYSLVDENPRLVKPLPGFMYRVTLTFRKVIQDE